jgi:uncharacterized membrane protein
MQFNTDSFIHEDGKENMLDNQGNEVFAVDMEVDKFHHPLENITDLNQYLDIKPPENMEQEKEEKLLEEFNENQLYKKGKRIYRSYKPEDKERFFFLFTRKAWA